MLEISSTLICPFILPLYPKKFNFVCNGVPVIPALLLVVILIVEPPVVPVVKPVAATVLENTALVPLIGTYAFIKLLFHSNRSNLTPLPSIHANAPLLSDNAPAPL